MKTAQKQTATLPDGRTVSRNSVHRYFYVVACFNEARKAWGALSWHHNYENAMTQTQSRWAKIYPQMRITPVIENMNFVA